MAKFSALVTLWLIIATCLSLSSCMTISQLHSKYYQIFHRAGNRNAASHLWVSLSKSRPYCKWTEKVISNPTGILHPKSVIVYVKGRSVKLIRWILPSIRVPSVSLTLKGVARHPRSEGWWGIKRFGVRECLRMLLALRL